MKINALDIIGPNDGEAPEANIINPLGDDFEGFELKDLIKSDNIAEMLSESQKVNLAAKCCEDLEQDERSMADWLDYADKAMELVKLEREEKHIPFRGAANIKYPLITTAVMQLCSRALEEFVKNGKVAHYKVYGKRASQEKKDKAERLSHYLNWMLLEEVPEWLSERNKLHYQTAVVGTSFTKTYWDPIEERVQSRLIRYDRLIVNNSITCLKSAQRVSEYIDFSTNELLEYMRADLFCDINLAEIQMDRGDPDAISHEVLEQHCWIDLDNDGYAEPYIVTIHVATGKLLRVVARYESNMVERNKKGQVKKIKAYNYYTDYHLLPSMDNTFFGIGFGTLLFDMNKTINTLLNQLTNAGTLATTQGGFISKDLKIRKEDLEVQPGEFIPVESSTGAAIKDNIVPFNYKEPSQVLMALVTFLIEGAQMLTSTTDSLTGTADTVNTSPNTLMMLIQQGLKVYSSIMKNLGRGFKIEMEKIVAVLAEHMDSRDMVRQYVDIVSPTPEEFDRMFDDRGKLTDWTFEDMAVTPVFDVNSSTEAEKLARATAALQTGMQIAQIAPGTIDMKVLAAEVFKAIEFPDLQSLVPPPPPPQPNPALIDLQSRIDERGKKLEIESRKVGIKEKESEAKIRQIIATAVQKIADAEGKQEGRQLDVYKQAFEQLKGSVDMATKLSDARNYAKEIEMAPELAAQKPNNGTAPKTNTGMAPRPKAPTGPLKSPPGPSMMPGAPTPAPYPDVSSMDVTELAKMYTMDDVKKEATRRGLLK